MASDHDDPIEADADRSTDITSAPSDNTTLTSVIEGLTADGYTAEFTPRPDAQVHCGACGNLSAAAELEVHSIRRLEGASDPDDMVAVVAAACPKCVELGTAVLAFGPMGSPTDADVMMALDLSARHTEQQPPAAPGEQQ